MIGLQFNKLGVLKATGFYILKRDIWFKGGLYCVRKDSLIYTDNLRQDSLMDSFGSFRRWGFFNGTRYSRLPVCDSALR